MVGREGKWGGWVVGREGKWGGWVVGREGKWGQDGGREGGS